VWVDFGGRGGGLRVSRTLRAAHMLAVVAGRVPAGEGGLAFMAHAPGFLRFPLSRVFGFVPFVHGYPAACDPLPIFILESRAREAGALFAAGVLAVAADAFDAEGGLATVASAVDAHADFFLDADGVAFEGGSPFAGVEGHVVFCEEDAGFFFLELAVFGGGFAGFGSHGCGSGFACFGGCGRGSYSGWGKYIGGVWLCRGCSSSGWAESMSDCDQGSRQS